MFFFYFPDLFLLEEFKKKKTQIPVVLSLFFFHYWLISHYLGFCFLLLVVHYYTPLLFCNVVWPSSEFNRMSQKSLHCTVINLHDQKADNSRQLIYSKFPMSELINVSS